MDLPKDLLVLICRLLNGPDVFALTTTCRRLYGVKASIFSLRMVVRSSASSSSSSYSSSSSAKRTVLLPNGLVTCLTSFSELRLLELHSVPLKGDHFDALFSHLAGLTSLSVVACPYFHQATIFPTRLESLFADATRINLHWAAQKGTQLPRLQHLSVRGCHRLTAAGLVTLLNHLTDLVSLNISGTELSACTLEQFQQMLRPLQRLQVLECRLGLGVSPTFYEQTLPFLPSLREIDATASTLDDATLCKLSRLDSVYLQLCPVTDVGCVALVERSPCLRVLNLLDCVGVSVHGVRALSGLVHLQELGLKGIFCSSQVLFSTLAQLSQLRVLNLDKCEVSDGAVRDYASSLPPLSILNMRECPELSNASLKLLCSYQTTLTILSLGGSKGISDVGIASVCTLPCLRILDISHLPCVTIHGLNTLRWTPVLWKVDLHGFQEALASKEAAAYQNLLDDLLARNIRILPAVTNSFTR